MVKLPSRPRTTASLSTETRPLLPVGRVGKPFAAARKPDGSRPVVGVPLASRRPVVSVRLRRIWFCWSAPEAWPAVPKGLKATLKRCSRPW